ncbi:hypothetical protein BDB00DRAFT_137541 [Zychaea mexicana]|uniref:uncharacterized protein n=1 Tax=Zychaea mexicana TaxID=64656 RepID=UPI0022FF212B|nr:uncharacterized protein BDB00DRAFT_137541 [Zychaea mexicana]KAI9496231.1 hypothetical protein BDB00DRAFT_137541 [Zychaea mexicana]
MSEPRPSRECSCHGLARSKYGHFTDAYSNNKKSVCRKMSEALFGISNSNFTSRVSTKMQDLKRQWESESFTADQSSGQGNLIDGMTWSEYRAHALPRLALGDAIWQGRVSADSNVAYDSSIGLSLNGQAVDVSTIVPTQGNHRPATELQEDRRMSMMKHFHKWNH